VTEVRPVAAFLGVHASDDIDVTVTVRPTAYNASLLVSANAGFIPKVNTQVMGGMLTVGLAKGATSSCVTVEIVVPQPLQYAGAFNGAEMSVDAITGQRLAASTGGELRVQTLSSIEPVAIAAHSRGEVDVANGNASVIAVTCSDKSNVDLGTLKVQQAVVAVDRESNVDNLSVGLAIVTATGESNVEATVTEAVIIVCSGSDIEVRGGGKVVQHASIQCNVEKTRGADLTREILP